MRRMASPLKGGLVPSLFSAQQIVVTSFFFISWQKSDHLATRTTTTNQDQKISSTHISCADCDI
eukprot:scaffold6649_cov65-Cylindrotheca_fusiformis.AAC.3